jgi:hypothetical protein
MVCRRPTIDINVIQSYTGPSKGVEMDDHKGMTSNRATRLLASTLGILVGLAGVEHGILEFLQGNVRPNGILIDAIGPEQRLWELSGEMALTIIPSFLISGILSVILGVLVTIWACAYVDRKRGPVVLLFLCVALFLVGGGFAPILLAVLAFIAATRIRKPLKFWRELVPATLRNLTARLWPWTLIIAVVSFVVAVEIAIFGDPILGFVGADTAYSIQVWLGFATLILAIVALPAANADDAGRLADQIA